MHCYVTMATSVQGKVFFLELDITNYDNSIELLPIDICQMNVKHQTRFLKKPSYSNYTIL